MDRFSDQTLLPDNVNQAYDDLVFRTQSDVSSYFKNVEVDNLSIASLTIPNLTVTGNETIGGTLGVTGASSLHNTTITGNETVSGTLGVTGATSLGVVNVSSNITQSAGNTILKGTTVDSNLTVNGNIVSTVGTLAITGNATIGSSLTTGGTATLQALNVTNGTSLTSTLSVGGNSNLHNTTIVGNETVSGTLGVTGNTTLNNLTVNGTYTGPSAGLYIFYVGMGNNATPSTSDQPIESTNTITYGPNVPTGDITIDGSRGVAVSNNQNKWFLINVSVTALGNAVTPDSWTIILRKVRSVAGTSVDYTISGMVAAVSSNTPSCSNSSGSILTQCDDAGFCTFYVVAHNLQSTNLELYLGTISFTRL